MAEMSEDLVIILIIAVIAGVISTVRFSIRRRKARKSPPPNDNIPPQGE